MCGLDYGEQSMRFHDYGGSEHEFYEKYVGQKSTPFDGALHENE